LIALFSTYFLVFYILIPGILFRFATSLFVRLKLFQRTRTQEATFAVAVAILPFAIALLGVWYVPGLQQYPFPNANASLAERRQDYHRIASLLTSSDASKLLNSTTASAAASARDTNWAALNRVLRRQARFLTWYFALIVLEGFFFGRFARKYGDWQSHAENYRIRLWFIRTFVLPSISEWHMLLTDFNFPKRNDLFVSVDVLQGDGLLYKGRVVEYFIDSDGKLTGILLKDVVRFDRQSYHDAKSTFSPMITGRTFPASISTSATAPSQTSTCALHRARTRHCSRSRTKCCSRKISPRIMLSWNRRTYRTRI